ncbi:peptidoglycan-binding domain-containing protein [Acidipila sp. EB88]|uniref:peptidoglycan-binding domain-containing protein n=1 Tax=Acidipila sp. EB88 TaxID=2305226 RepID=UPI000F5F6D6A|nr:peptidoglycan-binding domain-containing protein [Acidipila sp. EB88]RRA49515.1 peptidoglycan-binding protein [Acidipila sp. EB88]
MVLRSTQCLGLAFLLAVTPALASRSHRLVSFAHKKSAHGRHQAAAAPHWTPGQREIDPDRTRAIQTALISKSYLAGEPSGSWDSETEAAMQKFQGDNGWQTKLMPDSRALIKLGLGPNGAGGSAVALGGNNNGASVQQATGSDTLAAAHSILN